MSAPGPSGDAPQAPHETLEVHAPAKVNLGLRILGTRDDGYHLLESVFVPLDLGDTLTVTVAPGAPQVSLEVRAPGPLAAGAEPIPDDERNLAWRAAARFLERAGASAAVAIVLDKALPSAAGLGGGSSDAAAVLRALARLLPGALEPEALFELALSIGADVPYFLDPVPALVSGIGERIEPVPGLPGFALLLLNPGESASTPQVYGAWDARAAALTPAPPGSTMRALSALLAAGEGDWTAQVTTTAGATTTRRALLADLLINDLEEPAAELCPGIARLQAELRDQGALVAAMSGSGATVYGVFEDRQAASRAARGVRLRDGDWARVAHTLG